MKAIAYSMPGVKLIDVPEPTISADGQIKVKVAYASICGSDMHTYRGEMDESIKARGLNPKENPRPMGHEASGTVVEIGPGPNEKGFKIGDKVAIYYNRHCGNCYFCRNGQEQFCLNMKMMGPAMSEYLVLYEQQAFKLPEDADLARACIIEPISVCIRGIDLAGIRPGSKVLISGGGGVGLLLLQLAKMSGAVQLTVSEPVAEKRELAKKLGADFVIDPVGEDMKAKGREYTDNLGYDVIIETSGVTKALPGCFAVASRGATIELFAIYGVGTYEFDFKNWWREEYKIQFVFQSPYLFPRAVAVFPHINLDEYVKAIFPPERCAEGFQAHDSGKAVKVLFKFDTSI